MWDFILAVFIQCCFVENSCSNIAELSVDSSEVCWNNRHQFSQILFCAILIRLPKEAVESSPLESLRLDKLLSSFVWIPCWSSVQQKIGLNDLPRSLLAWSIHWHCYCLAQSRSASVAGTSCRHPVCPLVSQCRGRGGDKASEWEGRVGEGQAAAFLPGSCWVNFCAWDVDWKGLHKPLLQDEIPQIMP